MPSINSQVLENIASDLGQDVSVPGADLQEIVVPTVGLERYRRRITFFKKNAGVTVLNSSVKFEFASKKNVSRRLFLAEVTNDDTQAVFVVGQVRLTELTTFLIEPLNVRTRAGGRDVVVGDQAIVGTASGGRENFRPSSIWIPRGATLFITVSSDGVNFQTATNIQLRMLVEDEPPEESLVGGAPTSTVIG